MDYSYWANFVSNNWDFDKEQQKPKSKPLDDVDSSFKPEELITELEYKKMIGEI